MLLNLVTLSVGFALLLKGADWLVTGASALARALGVTDIVIGLTVVAFGTSTPELVVSILAAAKGNTLLNYAGIKPDLVPYVCDAAPSKHGRFLPGSPIPILPTEVLRERCPDVVLILPWNIADEIVNQHAYTQSQAAH